MVNMVLTCTEKHMLGHVRMYMHNVHVCMYACACMRFTMHSELRAYPSLIRAPSATEVPG